MLIFLAIAAAIFCVICCFIKSKPLRILIGVVLLVVAVHEWQTILFHRTGQKLDPASDRKFGINCQLPRS